MNNTSALSESPVKHTVGGEMPETTRFMEAKRRLRAATPIVTGRAGGASVLIPVLLSAVLLGGGYYLWNSYSQKSRMDVDTNV